MDILERIEILENNSSVSAIEELRKEIEEIKKIIGIGPKKPRPELEKGINLAINHKSKKLLDEYEVKPGDVLIRERYGEKYKVEVLPTYDLCYEGRLYKNLSAISKEINGYPINGRQWFFKCATLVIIKNS